MEIPERSAGRSGSGGGSAGPPARGLLKEQAYAELKRLILSGELAAGTFLTERQLAARLEVSKTPIRSALERLEGDGFVSIAPQRGAIVRSPSIREVGDLYEIRLALESFVARALAGRLAAEQVGRIRENLAAQRLNVEAGDVERGVELDGDFHGLFSEFLGNGEILRTMAQLRDKVRRVIFQAFTASPGRMAASVDEHEAIAAAVIAGDAGLAVRLLEEHLEVGKIAVCSRHRP